MEIDCNSCGVKEDVKDMKKDIKQILQLLMGHESRISKLEVKASLYGGLAGLVASIAVSLLKAKL